MKQAKIILTEAQGDNYNFEKVTTKLSCKNSIIKVISLFSGCGGLDLGFEGGFDVHQSCINDEDLIESKKQR